MTTPQRRDREPAGTPSPPGAVKRTIFVSPPPIQVGFTQLRVETPCKDETAKAVMRTTARLMLMLARASGDGKHETSILDHATGIRYKACVEITGGKATYSVEAET